MINVRLDNCPPELRERLRQGIEDLAQINTVKGDGRDWARAIIKRMHDGIHVKPATLKMACDALGLRDPRKASS